MFIIIPIYIKGLLQKAVEAVNYLGRIPAVLRVKIPSNTLICELFVGPQ